MHLYYAQHWLESLRSPTPYGFALKYAHIQKKSNKYIHYLCTHTYDECQRWTNGIRIVLYGEQLYRNYQSMKKIVRDGVDHWNKQLSEQRHLNFIQSNVLSMNEPLSSISLPINRIAVDSLVRPKTLNDIDSSTTKRMFHSLGMIMCRARSIEPGLISFNIDRHRKSKMPFARSTSFQSNLSQSKSTKFEQKISRTKSTSPTHGSSSNTHGHSLTRSKSARDIFSRSKSAGKSHKKHDMQTNGKHSSSLIPLIDQCIHMERTSKRSDPCVTTPNHVYDSLQDLPFPVDNDRRTANMSHMRVTEL
jgi:hypothetical protein